MVVGFVVVGVGIVVCVGLVEVGTLAPPHALTMRIAQDRDTRERISERTWTPITIRSAAGLRCCPPIGLEE